MIKHLAAFLAPFVVLPIEQPEAGNLNSRTARSSADAANEEATRLQRWIRFPEHANHIPCSGFEGTGTKHLKMPRDQLACAR